MSIRGDYLSGRWRYVLTRQMKRIWVRASMYSVAAILVALLGALVSNYISFPFELELAADAVDKILAILASSMLAVTTFSLSIMVSAYQAAASNSTPRATALLIADSVASNTLATFIGSFLFAIVGIVGLSTHIYGDKGRVVLFITTLVVLFLVTASLLRWIEQLTRFGRIGDTIERVEEAASGAARAWAQLPRLGARTGTEIPEDAAPLYIDQTGYIQHLDMSKLNELAESHGGDIHLDAMPGNFVGPHKPVAYLTVEPDGDVRDDMADCFTIGHDRSFEQDPRYGLVMLAEIASRALSPAVNDPGTAIAVLGAGVRVLTDYCDGHSESEAKARFDRIYAPEISHAEMLEDFITPIARDGAGLLEVQARLQRGLEMIALANRELFGEPAKRLSALYLKRALDKLDSPLERGRLERRARWALPDEITGESLAERAHRAEV